MKIYYRILSVNKDEHSIEVRYFTDDFDEDSLASLKDAFGEIIYHKDEYPEKCRTDYNLTLYDNPNPSVDELIKIIKDSAPIELFELFKNTQSNSSYSLENAVSMIGEQRSFDSTDE